MENNVINQVLESIGRIDPKKIEAKMIIAAKIDDALKKQNISRKRFMELLGKKDESQIIQWLSGKHNFTIETLVTIEDILKINLLNLNYPEQTPHKPSKLSDGFYQISVDKADKGSKSYSCQVFIKNGNVDDIIILNQEI